MELESKFHDLASLLDVTSTYYYFFEKLLCLKIKSQNLLIFDAVNSTILNLSQAAKLNSVNTCIFIMYCIYVLYVVCCSNECTMFNCCQNLTVNAATVVLKFHFSSDLSALVLIIFDIQV